MSRVFVHGLGAISPAGWGVPALRDVLQKQKPIATTPLARPGWSNPLQVRPVPPPCERPAFLAHPRLRRASTLTQHAVGAALEALGADAAQVQNGTLKLGIVTCLMSGCVTYSGRFFEEVLNDPAVASPLLFPETVFNAPGSHLAAYLNSNALNYTLVGDDAGFLVGTTVAAEWLVSKQVDACLVVGAEEMNWLVADAVHLFAPHAVQGAGAGAVYLRLDTPPDFAVELAAITDAFPFNSSQRRTTAARSVRSQLPPYVPGELLCLGTDGMPSEDADELAAWQDWDGARMAPKQWLGAAFNASAAWQCVAACDALGRDGFSAANVSVVGANQQAVGARFTLAHSASCP